MDTATSAAPLNVAIVGAGFIGRSWAIVFARAGHAVSLHDPSEDCLADAPRALAEALERMVAAGLVPDSAPILERIRVVPDLIEAVADADYVQENGPERLEIKREIFAGLERHAPAQAVLATSSSALTCTAICGDLVTRERCIVAHPANPPHLLKAVEVVPAPFTTPETISRTQAILAAARMAPVTVGEIDGFVMNRLQAALAAEALSLVEQGVASAEAVDAIVRGSLGLRWAFMGPFETMDLNAPGGFADYAQRYGTGFAAMLGAGPWPEAAVQAVDAQRRAMLPAEAMDVRREWRDGRLARLVAHLQESQV